MGAVLPHKPGRFSLLLLDDGEVLLSDVTVHYRLVPEATPPSPADGVERVIAPDTPRRGRLKVGTRNLFFDSDDWRDPVLRVPLSAVEHVSIEQGSQPGPEKDAPDAVVVLSSCVVYQRQHGVDHPYIENELRAQHIFTPIYANALQLRDELGDLIDTATISSRVNREHALRLLVAEREARIPFDITLLEFGVRENALLDASAAAIYALSRAPGRVRITTDNLYFMPVHGDPASAVERVPVKQILSVRRLRHGCRNAALEVSFVGSDFVAEEGQACATLMLSFQSHDVREKAVRALSGASERNIDVYGRSELEAALNRWRSGALSNFDYLMYLNMAAGRSFNDLSQYPVFPWVLCDYSSKVLDLENPASFRDLSKPIGALDPERLQVLEERYREMPAPRFYYGTHYSTPAYAINYLVRAAPAAMLRLQNGTFDSPDRLFHSIAGTWTGVMSNQSDVKELIPEFFAVDYGSGLASGVVSRTAAPGQFLDNVLGLELGTRQDGKRVENVELPEWANGSSETFVRLHRDALESMHVSSSLHHWIDLIFGVKSRNADARNVFYTDVALPSAMDDSETAKLSDDEISQIETVYLEFGRTPERLFRHPHPPRYGDLSESDAEDTAAVSVGSMSQDLCAGSAPQALQDVPRRVSSAESKQRVASPSADLESNSTETQIAAELASLGLTSNSDSSLARPGTQERVWGVRARRRDSVLLGATPPVLLKYCPDGTDDRGYENGHSIPESSIARVVDCRDGGKDTVDSDADVSVYILDVCLLQHGLLERTETSTVVSSSEAAICTVWSDGHLRVHAADSELLRTKHIRDISCIAYLSADVVAYGTLSGSIGLYHIASGRAETVLQAAHDVTICTLAFVAECNMLLSGSTDASVKVWRVHQHIDRISSLLLVQELDAESCVEHVAAVADHRGSGKEKSNSVLLVAVYTKDGHLIVWRVDLDRDEEEYFPEPIWRRRDDSTVQKKSDTNMNNSALYWKGGAALQAQRLCWLYQGENRPHALVSIDKMDGFIRVWALDQTRMAAAEVLVSNGGALCVIPCAGSRTVLVGGYDGQISEYDSTGLCLGLVTIAAGKPVRGIALSQLSRMLYACVGASTVLCAAR